MGFGMILERKNWLLYSFHIAFVLITPFLFSLLLGCNRIKAEKQDYGPEVSGDEIDHALAKAVAGRTFDTLAVGQYVDYDLNRRLENEETVNTLGGTHVQVIDKQEDTDTVKFTLQITKSVRQSNDSFETTVTEEPLILEKQKQEISLAQVVQSKYGSEALKVQAMSAIEPTKKATRTTFHRLQEFTQTSEAPFLTRNRAGCGGLAGCQYTIHYVFFDMVQWYDDGSSQKISLNFGFSADTPYLPFGKDFDQMNGLLVMDCRSAYIPITGRTVFVRDCQNLQDLQK
jgi:hypothetical protein